MWHSDRSLEGRILTERRNVKTMLMSFQKKRRMQASELGLFFWNKNIYSMLFLCWKYVTYFIHI